MWSARLLEIPTVGLGPNLTEVSVRCVAVFGTDSRSEHPLGWQLMQNSFVSLFREDDFPRGDDELAG